MGNNLHGVIQLILLLLTILTSAANYSVYAYAPRTRMYSSCACITSAILASQFEPKIQALNLQNQSAKKRESMMRNSLYLFIAFLFCQLSFAEGTHNFNNTIQSSDTDTTVQWHAVKVYKTTRAIEELKEQLENVPRATIFDFELKHERKNILEKIANAHTSLKALEPSLSDVAGRAKWVQLSNDFNALLRKGLSARTIYGNPNRLKVMDTRYHYYLSPSDIESYFLSGKDVK